MTLAKQTTDGPEWTLYNKDLVTPLGILQPKGTGTGDGGQAGVLYRKKNDVGSGALTIPITSPLFSYFDTPLHAIGLFIGLNYRGSYRGGFLVENHNIVDSSSAEYSGLAVTLSGRGELALLDDAVLWDWWTPGTNDIRYFGVKNAMPDGGHSVPMGEIMYKVLSEARDYQTNPSGAHLTRYCWNYPPGSAGTLQLAWDFSATIDTNSVAWSDSNDLEFRVGTSLLDIVKQFLAAQYDMTITRNPATGLFTLHAYNARLVNDLSGSIYFKVGLNCMSTARTASGSEVRNAVLVEFTDPVNPFTEVDDATSQSNYRRRESSLEAANCSTSTTAAIYGTAEIQTTKNPKLDYAFQVSDNVAPRAFVDYNVGDTVSYSDGRSAATSPIVITGIQASWPDDRLYADVTIESSST